MIHNKYAYNKEWFEPQTFQGQIAAMPDAKLVELQAQWRARYEDLKAHHRWDRQYAYDVLDSDNKANLIGKEIERRKQGVSA